VAVLDVVVLAGGVEKGELAAHTGTPYRPLLEVAGKPILHYVLTALNGSPRVDRVALVAPDPVLRTADELMVDYRVLSGESFVDNLLNGAASLHCNHSDGGDRLLIVTGDLPLLTSNAITDFVDRAVASRAEVAYPIIPKDSSERVFPGGKRTYRRLADGIFTGGNAAVLTREFLERSKDLIARLYSYRKRPLKLAGLFGPGFILGLVLGRLSIEGLEHRASEIVHARVSAIVCEYAELGFDVDKLDDLLLARQVYASVAGRS
jgi:GTP:adenosylcobinamide-phosphate guanylyltransferase